jgi:hypothetical protein
MKVFFELTAGVFIRGQVRQELNNSKEMIKHWYPEQVVNTLQDHTNLFFTLKQITYQQTLKRK